MKTMMCLDVPARDGVKLRADVYLPSAEGRFPVLLTRTPYGRGSLGYMGKHYTDRGYAFVAQDVRGKFGSEGEFRPVEDEESDGGATVEWIAEQEWCDGRVGLVGASYLGAMTQIPAAASGHKALKCMSSFVSSGSYFRDWVRYDGCFALANSVGWLASNASDRPKIPLERFDWKSVLRSDSIESLEEALGIPMPHLRRWIDHDTCDDLWKSVDHEGMYPRVTIPALHVGGWFDHISRGLFEAFNAMRNSENSGSAESQRLIIGPWGHGSTLAEGEDHRRYGTWDFGPLADLNTKVEEMRFLDYHFKGIDNGFSALPPVRLFLMGENRWVSFDQWPPRESSHVSLHLSSRGSANTRGGNGLLNAEPPSRKAEDTFRYNPADPVPTCGGAIYWGLEGVGPMDQREVLQRSDVLFYRGERLAEPLTVIGEIFLNLTVKSSAEDTDFIAKLCVEQPDGEIIVLTNGSIRCRYRESWSDPTPLAPGAPAKVRIHLGNTAYVFPEGSRIGVMITSSEFPRILPHRNTMEKPWHGPCVVADNSVLHGPGQDSCLELPVIEQSALE